MYSRIRKAFVTLGRDRDRGVAFECGRGFTKTK